MADARVVAKLLGGRMVLGRRVQTAMDLHEAMEGRLPREALSYFVKGRTGLPKKEILKLVGAREAGAGRLRRRSAARLFTLADTLAEASSAFGSETKAEQWLVAPLSSSMVNQRRPISLLTTPIGEAIVRELIRSSAVSS